MKVVTKVDELSIEEERDCYTVVFDTSPRITITANSLAQLESEVIDNIYISENRVYLDTDGKVEGDDILIGEIPVFRKKILSRYYQGKFIEYLAKSLLYGFVRKVENNVRTLVLSREYILEKTFDEIGSLEWSVMRVYLKADVNCGEFIPYELGGKLYEENQAKEVNPYYMLRGHRGEFVKRESEMVFDETIALNTAIKSLERKVEELKKLKGM